MLLRRTVLLLPVILLLARSSGAQQSTPAVLSPADKMYGLAQVWSEAKYNFVYMDKVQTDWDSLYRDALPKALAAESTQAYYDVLRRLVARLNDGHTSVWYPGSYYQKEFAYAPLKTELIEGRVFITRLLNDSLAQAGLERGTEILQVNGVDVHRHVRETLLPYEGVSTPQNRDFMLYTAYLLNGPVNEPLRLTVKDRKGRVREVSFSRGLKKSEPPLVQFRMRPDSIGVLTINGFTASDFKQQFDTLYPVLLKSKALVIDLRENTGGDGSQGEYMLRHFLRTPFPDPVISSRQHNPLFRIWGFRTDGYYTMGSGSNAPFTDRPIYDKPIAVLIGKGTASAAEDFTMPFHYLKRGPVVGQPSAGTTGQPLMRSLPGGGTLRICVRKDTYPDGKEFVGIGIQPTLFVPESAESFLKGEDAVMKKAVEMLK
ncbi:MAG TPA: S41 family peptidase [Chitinophagaceae bacterium]|jgi:C-terminal processing protease CtpA/Prc|nr:S41 family peptidase [Chitinophagaceae bacterium]